MKNTFLKATMGLGIMALAADQAASQPTNCAPRDIVLEQLSQKHKELRKAAGLASNNAIVEVFASETSSWTITATFPDGMTCLLASGQAFELDVADLAQLDPEA
ncbi:MAG: hypothetical protein ABJM82_13585 [Shimia thalassica]|uniref:hypothetical protein n=1 Tax=Shimia thalassica TaxID=1715693 RepID=UPI0032993E0E